jgi:hypothetical protein
MAKKAPLKTEKNPSKKTVRVEVEKTGSLALNLLTPLQGDLKVLDKENYEKLKLEILTDGFSFSVSVWENPKDGKIYILDGHQRYATLVKMKEEGYIIPQVPVEFVKAKDMKQALRKLLAAAGQYGRATEDGLHEIIKRASISPEELMSKFNFNELNLAAFTEKVLLPGGPDEDDINKYLGKDDGKGMVVGGDEAPKFAGKPDYKPDDSMPVSGQVRMVQLFFNGETQPEFLQKIQKLQEHHKCNNLTDAVLEVVREAFKALGKKRR